MTKTGGAIAACAMVLCALAPASGAGQGQTLTAQILDKIDLPSASPDGGEISELSGLAWDEDEKLLYGVSDAGYLVSMRIAVENDKLTKLEPVSVVPIEEYVGSITRLTWSLSDAEALLLRNSANGIHGDTEMIVALEDGPALARFDSKGTFLGEIKLPKPLDDASVYANSNKRLESVNEIPGHGIITVPEVPLSGEPEGTHTVYAMDGASWRFAAEQKADSSVKDIALLPDGRQLILERTRGADGQTTLSHLRLLDLANCPAGGACPVTDIAPSDPQAMQEDFEGLARISQDLYLLVTDQAASGGVGAKMALLRLR
jgi:Esterase-like activity of phytase